MAFWYVDINVLYVVGVQDTKEGIETRNWKTHTLHLAIKPFCDFLGDINASLYAPGSRGKPLIRQAQETFDLESANMTCHRHHSLNIHLLNQKKETKPSLTQKDTKKIVVVMSSPPLGREDGIS